MADGYLHLASRPVDKAVTLVLRAEAMGLGLVRLDALADPWLDDFRVGLEPIGVEAVPVFDTRLW